MINKIMFNTYTDQNIEIDGEQSILTNVRLWKHPENLKSSEESLWIGKVFEKARAIFTIKEVAILFERSLQPMYQNECNIRYRSLEPHDKDNAQTKKDEMCYKELYMIKQHAEVPITS